MAKATTVAARALYNPLFYEPGVPPLDLSRWSGPSSPCSGFGSWAELGGPWLGAGLRAPEATLRGPPPTARPQVSTLLDSSLPTRPRLDRRSPNPSDRIECGP